MNQKVVKAIKRKLGSWTPRQLREEKRKWNAIPRNARSIASLKG